MEEGRLKLMTRTETQYWKITNRPPRSTSNFTLSGDMFSVPRILMPMAIPPRAPVRRPARARCERPLRLHRHGAVEDGEAQRGVPHADQVVVLDVAAGEADAVHERAVAARQVVDRVLRLADDHDRGVLARHLLVVQDDIALLPADRVGAEAGDVERSPLLLSLDDRQVDRLPSEHGRLAQDLLRRALEGRRVDGLLRAGRQKGAGPSAAASRADHAALGDAGAPRCLDAVRRRRANRRTR